MMNQFKTKTLASAAFLLFWESAIFAQLITFNGTGNLLIPPGAPGQTIGVTESNCDVTGIGIIGDCVTIDNVEINLAHTWVGDIGILLIGPGGQVLELSTGNGGAGNDYTNTIFSDLAADFITSGAPPFTGTFKPEGRVTNLANPYSNAPNLGTHTFESTYTGVNADGAWTLYINDYVIADVGELLSWSITFNLGGLPPDANAGADINACPNQSTTLTASGGDSYLWSTGATTANILVQPTVTTTYSVTVTSTGCGTDTDEVVVTVFPQPTVSFTVDNPDVCAGGCTSVNANLTGLAPFTLTYTINGGGQLTEVFSSNTGTFEVCAPAGAPPGGLLLQSISLSDANCSCE
jgi:subtilisin-like proprotein convertase family protein